MYRNVLCEMVFTDYKLQQEVLDIAENEKEMPQRFLRQARNPLWWAEIYDQLKKGIFRFRPCHMGQQPKDDGTMRTVYIGEYKERILNSAINIALFRLCPDMVHESCKSYQTGIGTGKVVRKITELIGESDGAKTDMTKFFDSCSIEIIDRYVFDEVEMRIGKDILLDALKLDYHTNLIFDLDNNPIEKFTSLRQGNAVASFMADAILYEIDKACSEIPDVLYMRYSDDCIFLGKNWKVAFDLFNKKLSEYGLTVNPKKTQIVNSNEYFTFLGFSIKGSDISLSKKAVHTLMKEIYYIANHSRSYEEVVRRIRHYLYVGDGKYCWATSKLPIITNYRDMQIISSWIEDVIRYMNVWYKKFSSKKENLRNQLKDAKTEEEKMLLKKKWDKLNRSLTMNKIKPNDIGGIGYDLTQKDHVITRGKGSSVRTVRDNTEEWVKGFSTLPRMKRLLCMNRALFNAVARTM